MGERKVLIKYYAPDFDPSKLIKNRRPKDKQDNVRMMLPMSIRCNTCGNYMYIGTKFNMRKETCLNEDYLGIRIYRFYLKCTTCYAEVTFKTDPKNFDYVVEHGATRNYEPWRDAMRAEWTLKEMKENEEEGNAMKFLENKTSDSKREMDIMDAIDEIKQLNKRKALIPPDELLKMIDRGEFEEIDPKEEEDLIKKVFAEKKSKRLEEIEEQLEKEEQNATEQVAKLTAPVVQEPAKPQKKIISAIKPVKVVKAETPVATPKTERPPTTERKKPMLSYSDDDE
eukprot:TRINITY_DN4295_c0_g1_i5.p1 TRINITY_DN4295_c0_g1~~TRINITY_DN4295_c0_g1_i5.p1  ORF type:complete len:283 (+),score=84.34 TRINITY_DN4295_c0_g1_i5:40-888(+)